MQKAWLADLVTPSVVSRRRYKNQPELLAEQTLKFYLTPLHYENETSEALTELLHDANILTRENIVEALNCNGQLTFSLATLLPNFFPFLAGIMDSLRSLASKLAFGLVSQQQAMVAANQLFLTGCSLADALTMVDAANAYTTIDFLKEVGIDVSNYDEDLAHNSTSRAIINRLTALGYLDEETIRVATRLRYLICQRKLSCKQAWDMFAYYTANQGEAEEIIDQTLAQAA